MSEGARPVLVHVHLFKNAGTSVEAGLRDYFGDSWASHDRAEPGAIGMNYLQAWLDQRPHVKAVSSHQVRPPFDSEAFKLFPIVFLRHPLDRIRSAFDFEKRQGPVTPSSAAAAKGDLGAWIEFHRGRNSAQCSDFHLTALSTLRWAENWSLRHKLPKQSHLDASIEFLESLPTFGIVEDYDESWRRITTAIRVLFPDFSGRSVQANLTESRQASLDDRLTSMRSELGRVEYDRLTSENSFDIELYQWAIDVFSRRLGESAP